MVPFHQQALDCVNVFEIQDVLGKRWLLWSKYYDLPCPQSIKYENKFNDNNGFVATLSTNLNLHYIYIRILNE